MSSAHSSQTPLNPESSHSANVGNSQQNPSVAFSHRYHPYNGESVFNSNRANNVPVSSHYRQEALLRAQKNNIASRFAQNTVPRTPVYQVPNTFRQYEIEPSTRPIPPPRYPALLFPKLEEDRDLYQNPRLSPTLDRQSNVIAPIPQPYDAQSKERLNALVAAENRPENVNAMALNPNIRQQELSSGQTFQSRAPYFSAHDQSRIRSKENQRLASVQSWLDSQKEIGPADVYEKTSFSESTPVVETADIGETGVRPVSPATMIALTEPILLNWCFDDDAIERLAKAAGVDFQMVS